MKNLKNILLPVLALLSGCQFLPLRLQPETLQSIESIAVISIASDQLYRKHVGFTIFGNEQEVHDIRGWKLDELYAAKLAKVISEKTRYRVLIPEHSSYADLFNIYAPKDLVLNYLKWKDVQAKLVGIAEKYGASIILLNIRASVMVGSTNQSVGGAHILTTLSGRREAGFASSLYLVDGKSGKPIAQSGIYLNSTDISKALADKSFEAMSADEEAGLREVFAGLFDVEKVAPLVVRFFQPKEKKMKR